MKKNLFEIWNNYWLRSCNFIKSVWVTLFLLKKKLGLNNLTFQTTMNIHMYEKFYFTLYDDNKFEINI